MSSGVIGAGVVVSGLKLLVSLPRGQRTDHVSRANSAAQSPAEGVGLEARRQDRVHGTSTVCF